MRAGPFQFHSSRVSHGAPYDSTPDMRNVGGNAGGRGAAVTGKVDGETMYGWASDEYNPVLIGSSGVATYDRMRRSSAHVRSSLRMVKTPILSAEWYMKPASDDPLHVEQADLAWFALNNMHRPFIDFLREGLSCLDFGMYHFEKLWEVTTWTPNKTDERPKPRQREIFKWLDMEPRHPKKVVGFKWYNNYVTRMVYGLTSQEIDYEKLLCFALDQEDDNPWGMSILRSAYMHWYYLDNLYRIDGIQKERHGIGIPVIELPPGATNDDKTAADNMGRNLRTNEKAHAVLPYGWKLQFASPNTLLVDPLKSAEHHAVAIYANVLAQFLSLGTNDSGSRAVGSVQVGVFERALRWFADWFRGVINTYAIPELIDYNYNNVDAYPELSVRRVADATDWRTFSVAIRNLVEPGIITPTPELEEWMSEQLDFPIPAKEALSRPVSDRVKKPVTSTNGKPEQGSRTGRPNDA